MPVREVAYLDFNLAQSQALESASQRISELGGPEARGAATLARLFAEQLKTTLCADQNLMLQHFDEGQLSALMFRQLPCPCDSIPEHLGEISELTDSQRCQYLASRNQILLELAQHRCFAFDIDNEGKQVRLVGNFKGGGRVARFDERPGAEVELSSHAGSVNPNASSAAARAFGAFRKALSTAWPRHASGQPASTGAPVWILSSRSPTCNH